MTGPVTRARESGSRRWGTGWRPSILASAPGRIELLGNHIDYNGGPVLAAAIDRRAIVLGQPWDEFAVEIAFADTGGFARIDPAFASGWRNQSGEQQSSDYARGVVAALIARQRQLRPGRYVLASDVPIGIGVSSSAAICVALTLALSANTPTDQELVLTAQEAEHRAGTPCGTMDQSASVAGGVILFDGAKLDYQRMTPELTDVAFLVIDSGVHRALSGSSYPVRVDECGRARRWLSEVFGKPVEHLAGVSPDDLEGLTPETDDEALLLRRVRHVAGETTRVAAGTEAIGGSDWVRFGRLMTESGRSSAGDYDISHPVVEAIVGRLNELDEVLGARMMGGGEGGSLIALVRAGGDPAVQERIAAVVNLDLPEGVSPRQVFAFSFAPGAGVEPFDQ